MKPVITACLLGFFTTAALAQTAPDPLGLGKLGAERPPGSKTEITAQKEATFDEQTNTAVFFGEVRVSDPSFLLSSDKLTVKLTADRSGIERALAEGNVIIVQQTSETPEKAAVGRAQRAEYIPASGRVTLSGMPEIQQGINRHIATSPGTRMIIHRDGRATTEGPSRTVITDTAAPTMP
jgi:lipopolysaccharide transport protein LptA